MELAGKEECSLGYSKLTYEEYIENPEVYLARGILAPKWANELYGKGYKGVCAIDFYDDIFGGDLEEHRMPEDYRTGEYAAIAIEQVKQVKDGKETIKGRRITVILPGCSWTAIQALAARWLPPLICDQLTLPKAAPLDSPTS